MPLRLRLDLKELPLPSQVEGARRIEEALHREMADLFPDKDGYSLPAAWTVEPPGADGIERVRISARKGLLWGVSVLACRSPKDPAARKFVLREAIPLIDRLKNMILGLAFLVAVVAGVACFIAGIMDKSGSARKGIVFTSLILGGLSGVGTGVAGLTLLGPLRLLGQAATRNDVHQVSQALHRGVQKLREDCSIAAPMVRLRSTSGAYFLASLLGAGLLAFTVGKARQADDTGPLALWILAATLIGLGTLATLASHLADEFGLKD